MTLTQSSKLEPTGQLVTKYQARLDALPFDHEITPDEFSSRFSIPTHISKQGRNRILGAAFEEFVSDALIHNTGKIFDDQHNRRELADACVGPYALEIKYRANMNDAKILRGVRSIGRSLINKGYTPVALICREDNSTGFINAARDYLIVQGYQNCLDFISLLNSTKPTE